jgi:hypothetical protein
MAPDGPVGIAAGGVLPDVGRLGQQVGAVNGVNGVELVFAALKRVGLTFRNRTLAGQAG